MRLLLRRFFSFLLSHSFSKRLNEIILWPISKRIFADVYWSVPYSEVVKILPNVQMVVYGDMEDMVNKILLFFSGYRKLSWEPVTARLVEILAPKIKCAVVAGAHIGYYPLIIAGKNSSAKIFAFEPNPSIFVRLKKNISLNRFSNISAQSDALGAEISKKRMYFDFGQSSFVDSPREHAGCGMVSLISLDSFFEDRKNEILPDLIILDAEGYEPNIIKGAEKVIKQSCPDIIFELNQTALSAAGHSPDALCEFLSNFGYSIFIIEDDYSHCISAKKEPKIVFSQYKPGTIHRHSFVNAFATTRPESLKFYTSQ